MTVLEPNFDLEKKLKKGIDAILEGMVTLELNPKEKDQILRVLKRYQDIYDLIRENNQNYKKLQKTIEKAQITKIENTIKNSHKISEFNPLGKRVAGSFESKK